MARMVAKVQISARIHRKVFLDVVFRLSSRSWVVKNSFRAFDRREEQQKSQDRDISKFRARPFLPFNNDPALHWTLDTRPMDSSKIRDTPIPSVSTQMTTGGSGLEGRTS